MTVQHLIFTSFGPWLSSSENVVYIASCQNLGLFGRYEMCLVLAVLQQDIACAQLYRIE